MSYNEKTFDQKIETVQEPTHDMSQGEEVKLSQIDTMHNDEALKVVVGYSGEASWTPEEEKRLVKKIDRRILVIVVITFGVQFYDKYLFSHAALFGMRKDLHLSIGNRYSMAGSIFYLGYILGAYPATFLAQRYRVNRVIFALVLLWGIDVLSGGFCQTWRHLYVQRFFLGLLEAGMSPVWMMVIGGWYTKKEQTLRNGVWFAAASMVTIPAPLINFGIGHIHGTLSPWRYMFIFAGSITIIWSLFIISCMDSDPVTAAHLNEREKYIAVSRLRKNNSGVRNTHFKGAQVLETCMDIRFWLLVLISIGINTVTAVSTTFIPLIINLDLGFSGLNSLLLTMPVGVVGLIATIGSSWVVQRFSHRNFRVWSLCISLLICMVMSLLIWQIPHMVAGAKLFVIYLLAFQSGAYAVLMSLTINNCAGYTKRSTMSAGNFVSPMTFLESETPIYNTGWAFVMSMQSVSIVLALLYRFLVAHENKTRDAAGFSESFDHAFEDDQTDKSNMNFRYVY
ncbi:transporter [Fusarium acutatum]|uniref:Transporter n=1 Tax=Fusarium acutatum TaxID=78861 RepID=A0A8H4NN90_9HYPO|nr:transporter [Fusarium acutatum]